LLLSQAFSVGIPSTVGFMPQLVVISDLFGGNPFDGGILGFYGAFDYHEAFSQSSPLSRRDFGYYGAFHELLFFTMEFRLSRSLFTNFSFTRWNLGYHGAFSRIFLSHDGISAMTEPSHEPFFFTMEFSLSRSLLMNFYFFTMEF
jgi:hypothetical protein